jgi:hypothetical protein
MCGSFLHAFYAQPLRVSDPTQKQLLQIQSLLSHCLRCRTFVTCSPVQTFPELRIGYVPEGPEQHEYCASHNWEHMTYIQGGAASSVCLPSTPARHCHTGAYPAHRPGSHTGVSTQHTGPALSHRCLPNTPARHCHTGVYPTHLPHKKSVNVSIQLLHVSTPPVTIKLTAKEKYEQLYTITTLVSRSDRNTSHFHKNKICLNLLSFVMLRRVDWPSVTVSRQPFGSIRMGQAASVPEGQ